MRESRVERTHNGIVYTRKVPRTGDHDIRLVRCKYKTATFPAGKTKGGARRKPHNIWSFNYVVANAVLTAIVRDGIGPQDLSELRRIVNEKLKERFGGVVTCAKLEWFDKTFAYNAKLVVKPISEEGRQIHSGLVWNILFWDVDTAVKQFEEHALPTLAPMVLVHATPRLDIPWKFGQALRTHGFRLISTLPGRNRVRAQAGEGSRFEIDDTLTVKGVLYAGAEYERVVTVTLSRCD